MASIHLTVIPATFEKRIHTESGFLEITARETANPDADAVSLVFVNRYRAQVLRQLLDEWLSEHPEERK